MADTPYHGMPADVEHAIVLGCRRHMEGVSEHLSQVVKDRCNRDLGADEITQRLSGALGDLVASMYTVREALALMSVSELQAAVTRTAPTPYEPPALEFVGPR